MASCVIPIREIRAASEFGTSLKLTPALPSWHKKVLIFFYLPRVLRFVTTNLSGERLGHLSREQAHTLYEPLNHLHTALNEILEHKEQSWERWAIRWWMRRVAAENEKIGDILEALAWGSEDDLRGFIDSSTAAFRQRLLTSHTH